ncbi:PIG-L family deacetylase [Phenylobacterium aquaticum]|uniref:PIG-L family deacetylase n=1 Tax=Phenylobacterium aquaticum TaxID=1763816 RepID=UPI0026F1CA50|nr:PIG-L family deacetylase [Phenylobacterium aquaticum]
MTVVHLLAHFDDEYCALPLVRALARAGRTQRFVYVADYATPGITATRLAETRALLAELGIGAEAVIHAGAGVMDGALHTDPMTAWRAVRPVVAGIGAVSTLVTTAWEGGHADHDLCAAMAVKLQDLLPGRPGIRQIALYHGRGTWGPLFQACDPIRENGPVTQVPMTAGQWLSYAAAVRHFPSQWKSWAGLWPAMFITFAGRGFGVQALEPARVRARPHLGRLLYERRFGVSYEEVRAAADLILDS